MFTFGSFFLLNLKLKSCPNFRRALPQTSAPLPLPVYRSCSLDNLSVNDSVALSDFLEQGGIVVDLRNADERSPPPQQTPQQTNRILHRPLLYPDRLWPKIESQLTIREKLICGFPGPLLSPRRWNSMLYRALEKGGLMLLYKTILETSEVEIAAVLNTIVAAESGVRAGELPEGQGSHRPGFNAAGNIVRGFIRR